MIMPVINFVGVFNMDLKLKQNLDLMVNIEALATSADAAVLSVSVVPFLVDGDINEYQDDILDIPHAWGVDLTEQLLYARTVDSDILDALSKIDDDDKQKLLTCSRNCISIESFCNSLHDYIVMLSEKYNITAWSWHTSSLAILESLSAKYSHRIRFSRSMDLSTFVQTARIFGYQPVPSAHVSTMDECVSFVGTARSVHDYLRMANSRLG